MWGWAMPKGVFGSKNQAAWVWTAGDTDSDLLTDDDQFGRKCSEPVTICRRELWGRIFGVQDCSYLTLMIWKGGGSVPIRSPCWAMEAWFGQGFLAVREDHFYGDLQVGYFRLQEPKVNFSGEVQVSYPLISNFLIFSFYFTHTGLEVIDTCAALCSLARTFVILNAPLGFSCFLLDRTLEGGWFVVTSQQNCFHWVIVASGA